ncbi:S9 family peptidase [Maribacter antarcticus]|uniref:S9 family peptidase n=1 Tax=Maribacter antarcticus TaxID=505250 RepID=UPI00047ECA01|nr:prolyl oligopeptidase family serine peptidase [Maribacter antarcticus]
MNLNKTKRLLISLFAISTIVLFVNSLEAQEKKLITPEEYGKWELLESSAISKDGKWSSYQVDKMNKDRTTILYNIIKNKTISYDNTAKAKFSKTGNWFVYEKVLTGKEQKIKDKKDKKDKEDKKEEPEMNDKVLVNLSNSDTLLLKGVIKYSFNEKDTYFAMLRENEGVNTLIIQNLKTQSQMSFGNIKSFDWQTKGELLAMIVETKDSIANGIQLYDPNQGILKVLDQSAQIYSHLEWGEKSDYLFAIKAIKKERSEEESYQLLHWKDFSKLNPIFSNFNPNKTKSFPDAIRILSDNIKISDDGNSVFFETYSWIQTEEMQKNKSEEVDEKNAKEGDDYEAPDLEIWHSKDELMITQQKKSTNKSSEEPIQYVWHVDKNSNLPLSDKLVENMRLQVNNKMMIGFDQSPYSFDAMFGRPSNDIYIVNIEKGEKKKVLTNIKYTSPVSPNGKYFVFVEDNNLHLYDIVKESSTTITSNLEGTFIQGDAFDYPVDEKPPFDGGLSAWSKDGNSFLFNSEFDVWQGFVNGSPSKRLTKGKEDEIIYRHWFVYEEDKFIDLQKEQFFSMRGKKSKKSGYSKGILGKKMKTLIYDEARIYPLDKPHQDLDILTYRTQSFNQSPNLSITDLNFLNSKGVSNTNSFQDEYAWGEAELITYTNAKNKSAQGILYYPANYQKGKIYPMITYVYETLSDRFHRYTVPSKTNYYNTTVWQQEGYFVLKPDIEFIAGDPGVSSAKTLENAVAAVIEKGDVDPKKVGLIGHSWGGYQAGFVPTQTDIFAASVAGAGLTNFISMYLAITPAFEGSPENAHFEISQERMISPPWKSPENYLRNSSVMNVESLNTPILFEVGDNDMNVNWRQGIEYYNAARRAGKQFVMLVYANEGHGIKEDKNASDYQQKILKWFGHYLKGEEAEDWILKGIPYREQLRRLKKAE